MASGCGHLGGSKGRGAGTQSIGAVLTGVGRMVRVVFTTTAGEMGLALFVQTRTAVDGSVGDFMLVTA